MHPSPPLAPLIGAPSTAEVEARCQAQHHFHRELQGLLAGSSSLRRPLRFAAGLIGLPPSLTQCARVIESYRRFTAFARPCAQANQPKPPQEFVLPPYAGTNRLVHQVIDLLRARGMKGLHAAVLHGSLASNEEIPYSDFDGLVILSDDCLREERKLQQLVVDLASAQQLVFQLDPLQHHGWFALSEADLDFYPDDHLPHAVYAFSVSLSGQPCHLALRPRPSIQEFRASFISASGGLRRRLQSDRSLRNLYELKCTLSVFMLLPALYVQARDARGIHKKLSFELAATDFTESEWLPMGEASAIRLEWPKVRADAWCRLGDRFPPLRRHVMHRFGPPIPTQLRSRLSPALFSGMLHLADAMARRLGLPSHDAAR